MKYAQCDNCGAKDDWMIDRVPILHAGAVLQLRDDGGGQKFEHTLELCETCRQKVLDKFPNLKKATSDE